MNSPADHDLVRQFQGGDEQAFAALVRRHQDRVYRLARVRLYAAEDAGDAAQEVFLRAYKGLRRFRFRAEPFTWLYRTLINVCNEYNRRHRRHRRLEEGLAREPDTGPATDKDEALDDMQAVQRLIRKLPRRQQDVVLLRMFEELSVEETARAMGCRPGTVKAHLHKALQNLRQQLTQT